jgi:hypothetical protein
MTQMKDPAARPSANRAVSQVLSKSENTANRHNSAMNSRCSAALSAAVPNATIKTTATSVRVVGVSSRPADAASIAAALGGRKSGGSWMAPCPAHNDSTPSLSLRNLVDGKVLVYCHAGCAQDRVISELRKRGIWPGNTTVTAAPVPADPVPRRVGRDEADRSAAALAIWKDAVPARGTLVEAYLASRGLILPPSATLRFHPDLMHPSGGRWPAMVALVTRGCDGVPLAIHRTFLARDGSSKAPVDPEKMMLGPCRGGVVRLADPSNLIMVGEGIETCLSALMATSAPAWAALSTSGLRSLELAHHLKDVIVLADSDEAGETAAFECAARWTRQGRRVRIARPPRRMDFNDLLCAAESAGAANDY